MNNELSRLAGEAGLDSPAMEHLRLAFGLACAERVRHLLEDAEAVECLAVFRSHVTGEGDAAAFDTARAAIAEIANRHRGSNSIDGTKHAAVSATYALAKAMAGRALEAAGYAAYATVYAYGGYAVTDPAAFESEFAWQIEAFKALRANHSAGTLV